MSRIPIGMTPEQWEAEKAIVARAVTRARKTLKIGDVVRWRECGARGSLTVLGFDSAGIVCGRVRAVHPINIWAVNGKPVNFGHEADPA